MLNLDSNQTVGDLVRQNPNRARVFEKLKIDYCCGGKLPLSQVCEKRGLDASMVLQQIATMDAAVESQDLIDVDAMTLSELADHVEATHHAFLREELPRLDFMTERVATVHGDRDHRLQIVRDAFVALNTELVPHMMKEERVLFPLIRQLEASSAPQVFHCGSIANPIRQMELEHDHSGRELAILSESTDGYVPPDWACNTYRAMLDSLRRLEADMHQHVHKENNVLFPKAIQLERSLEQCRAEQ